MKPGRCWPISPLSGILTVFAIWTLASVSLMAVDYRIEASLDTKNRMISGQETLSWRNDAEVPVSELQFHLYFNAWRDKNSSFLNSNRVEAADFSDWRDGDWGSCDIERLEVRYPDTEQSGEKEAVDLTQQMEFIQPDDFNPQDRTVVRVILPEPVQPGAELSIAVEFQTKVPRPFARTGVRGDYYFLAHWFPKIGVVEADGAWNCHQFIQTEFYSNFGDYDVELRLPSGWKVGATGRLTETRPQADSTVIYRFVEEQVHEFAWTTSPHFLEFSRRFEHSSLPAVDMKLLLMPDHVGQEDRYFAATEATLRLYGEWFGAYPYGHVTVVDPAYGSRSGGMEYPTLFTGGTRWLNPAQSGSPEGVTIHECGHQFWYGLIGNNEFEDAWLDEGFDTYSTRRVREAEFQPTFLVRRYFDGFFPVIFRDLPASLRSFSGLGGYYSTLKLDEMSKPSWKYGPASFRQDSLGDGRVYRGGAYGVNSYTKPAMMLLTLERYLGWETFQKGMSIYFERFKFKSPKPEDFFGVLEEVSGENLDWFWEETYRSSNIFDYAADSVGDTLGTPWTIVRRWGEGRFPVKVQVEFADGEIRLEQWDGRDRWHRFAYPGKSEITKVIVDPDEVLALDTRRVNNTWVRDSEEKFAARKWAIKWMLWLQNTLEMFAFFS